MLRARMLARKALWLKHVGQNEQAARTWLRASRIMKTKFNEDR